MSDNEKASRYLSKFALMIRMTLNHSKDIFVTLDENIEYLKAYLEMEQLRFDDSFNCSIHTDENIDVTGNFDSFPDDTTLGRKCDLAWTDACGRQRKK